VSASFFLKPSNDAQIEYCGTCMFIWQAHYRLCWNKRSRLGVWGSQFYCV